MARIAVRRLKYSGTKYEYESPELKDGLVILLGENGTGKTTFSELIYYGLGGAVEIFNREGARRHKEITSDTDNFVQLEVELDGVRFRLLRYIGSNDVAVSDPNTNVEILPIYRKPGVKIFSDWLMEKLHIEQISIVQGTRTFVLNIHDVFRLIYHNQEANPEVIFKSPDVANAVTDARELRRAIFEVLLGKALQDYYRELGIFKKLERERNEASASVKVFGQTIQAISKDKDEINLAFLMKMLDEKVQRVSTLEQSRTAVKKRPPVASDTLSIVEDLKRDLLSREMSGATIQEKRQRLIEEIRKLNILRNEISLEIDQIKKIIFTHEQLALFSPDTCPYCLRDITRPAGHCICGTEVNESKYQRFFYNPSEYIEIAKSKGKNVETIEIAIDSYSRELETTKQEEEENRKASEGTRAKVQKYVSQLDSAIDTSKLDEIDDELLRLRTEIGALEQQINIEKSRAALLENLKSIGVRYSAQQTKVARLQASVDEDMQRGLARFNDVYNRLVTTTLSSVHSAELDDKYMPILNHGEYKEKSSGVPKRLLYYYTLLKLSIDDPAVPFPRFLLIDTPNTVGIDRDGLLAAMRKITEVMRLDAQSAGAQVILTTGLEDFPNEFEGYVFQKMPKGKHLLLEKGTTPIN